MTGRRRQRSEEHESRLKKIISSFDAMSRYNATKAGINVLKILLTRQYVLVSP